MTLKTSIMLEEDMFPKLFTSYEERSFGVLFYNEFNKTSYDSNHAVIYKDKIEDLKLVLDEITTFYKNKDIHPSVYQAITDENYFSEMKDVFLSNGYKTWSNEPANFMVLNAENQINVSSNLNVVLMNEWDERIANDICIPSDEAHEVDVFKAGIESKESKVFVGYIDHVAVAITSMHDSNYNCCRYDYILVTPEYRRNGHARALLSFVTDYCREHNIQNCYQWPAHASSERLCYEAGFRSFLTADIARASYIGE